MGTSKMDQNKDDIIKSLKEKVAQQEERFDRLYKQWSDTADYRDELWKENREAMDKITKLQFENIELQKKNEKFRSKVNYLEKVVEILAKENDDKRNVSRIWKKRYYRLKKRKNSDENFT